MRGGLSSIGLVAAFIAAVPRVEKRHPYEPALAADAMQSTSAERWLACVAALAMTSNVAHEPPFGR